MRLTILGGGGFRVPLIYRALLADREEGRVTHVTLHDLDPSRLAAIGRVLAAQAGDDPDAPEVTATTDLTEALTAADFVFFAVRVHGLRGRAIDERVALDEGVLGQETVGAGGVAYGLRTVPVAIEVARRVAEVAPHAWVINFTNPAGMVTEAMAHHLGERVIGICDEPVGLGRRVLHALGADPAGARLDYVGLNHLGWLRGVEVDGRDVLPGLLADVAALKSFEEGRLFGTEWIRTLGAIPNPYLHYYYFNREAVAAERAAGQTRGAFLLEQQGQFYARLESGGRRCANSAGPQESAPAAASPADRTNDRRDQGAMRLQCSTAESRNRAVPSNGGQRLAGDYRRSGLTLCAWSISSMIRCAAARGSGAFRIGRPITR